MVDYIQPDLAVFQTSYIRRRQFTARISAFGSQSTAEKRFSLFKSAPYFSGWLNKIQVLNLRFEDFAKSSEQLNTHHIDSTLTRIKVSFTYSPLTMSSKYNMKASFGYLLLLRHQKISAHKFFNPFTMVAKDPQAGTLSLYHGDYPSFHSIHWLF